jgi:putative SOS response-associated peptidase YedK
MCNLYSITTNQEAIRALFRVMNRYVGNQPPMPGGFPHYLRPSFATAAPSASSSCALRRAALAARTGGPTVTNIRDTSSLHCRERLKSENRRLVPFKSFAEYAPGPNPNQSLSWRCRPSPPNRANRHEGRSQTNRGSIGLL